MEGAARRAEVRSVSKVFGSGALQTAVLEGVSLSVQAGEVLMLVGPSGSGKTTLLSILGCVLNATSGQVWVAGHDVGRRTPDRLADLRRRRIGFVFQQHNLLACLSAVENVEVPLLLEGIGGAERRRRAQEALERVRMGDRLHAKPRQLSGGQQQRVAIARACVLQPELLLCDEPTASLDWHSGQLVIDLLRELAHAQRRAVIVVTHDARLFPYADRMIEMEDGRIVRQSGAAP